MKPLKIIIVAIIALIVIAFFIRLSNDNYTEPIEELESPTIADSVNQSEIEKDKIDYPKNNITDFEYSDSLQFEIPRIIDTRAEQILTREGYTCSYNQDTRNANWVAWHLTKEHANGPWTKKGIPYIEDEDVKGYRQENSDWESIDLSDAGIDHGHICPAADNKWSKNAMVQSYLLTNMCPQNANLNRGIWENLESRCRGWARHYGEIFIVAGPIFYSNNYKTIGANKIGIPDAFYKVVLCLSKEPKALGFIFPNSDPIYSKIADYLLSVDQVEEITKIDFFHNLEDSIENIIEANSNLNKW